ncbi:MAG: type II CRISPR RNA-guided endonuclease Cas9 [Bdellovibrionales bacterium]
MAYNLGIDMGITSVGFAGVDRENESILFSNAHIFDAAETADGGSLAADRGKARRIRRLLSRRAARKKDIRALLAEYGLRDLEAIDYAPPEGTKPPISPWDLRKAALERKLADAEFARVLFHIAKRRGFQSNKKGNLTNDTEGKVVLESAIKLEEAARDAGAETEAAYLAAQPKQRNDGKVYTNSIKRDSLRREIKRIFDVQRQKGNAKATEDFLLAYAGDGDPKKRNTLEGDGIAFYQRPLQSAEDMIGFCAFERNEKRAPKFAYTAELFVLWSRLNNTIIRCTNGNEDQLTADQKRLLADLAHKETDGVRYAEARKALGLTDNERFNIGYRKIKNDKGNKDDADTWEKIRDITEKKVFLQLPGYHALKKALNTGSITDWQQWIGPKRDTLDEMARILSYIEDKEEFGKRLSALGIDEATQDKLASITNFKGTVSLSLKAIRIILPDMQKVPFADPATGQVFESFDDIKKKHGYSDHLVEEKKGCVPSLGDTLNPVVKRALAQARKIINACIRTHGMPETIIVELGRDIGKPMKGYWVDKTGKKKLGKGDLAKGDRYIMCRADFEKENEKNWQRRQAAAKAVAEIIGIHPALVSGGDVLKHRLWIEQKNVCPYCCEPISPAVFKADNATQIDHIPPYSQSWDVSYMNKVLVHLECNQKKLDKIPFDIWGKTPLWEKIKIIAQCLPKAKQDRILMEEFSARAQGWKDRALNDTRYMARELRSHLQACLPCKVEVRNGAVTAHLRGLWGFTDEKLDSIIHILQSDATEAYAKKQLEALGLKKYHVEAALHVRDMNQAEMKKVLRGFIHYKDRTNDRHHALDAIVLACSTQSMVQDVARQHKYNKKAREYPKPWETFREDTLAKVYGVPDKEGIIVSRLPDRSATGAAHQDTVYSLRKTVAVDKKGKEIPSTTAVSRMALQDLFDVRKKGDDQYAHLLSKVEKIYYKKDRARGVYEALKERVETCRKEGRDPKTVFDEPVYMKASVKALAKGKTHGEQIKHVQMDMGYTTGLVLDTGPVAEKPNGEKLGAIAPNTQGGMLRVDVFTKPNGKGKMEYYLCPVYISNIAKGELPRKAIVANKPEKEWTDVSGMKFLFSLYKNDYIKIENRDGILEGYYKGANRATNSMEIITHDRDPSFGKNGLKDSIGVKTLLSFEKYNVNYFGEKFKIKKEKRLGLTKSAGAEASEAVAEKRAASAGE